MNSSLLLQILYIAIIVAVVLRIIYDTKNTAKALALIMIVVFVPILGIIVYLMFGVNYRKHKIFNKKLKDDLSLIEKINQERYQDQDERVNPEVMGVYSKLVQLVIDENQCPLTRDNQVKLLVNGENKFPEMLADLENAKHFIHLEYYIFEDDDTGRAISNILIKKAKEGVKVRFIYDDLGSQSIKNKMVPRLREAGVHVYPFFEIKFMLLANRLNYRNHRKITIIDGHTAYVGGINVGQEYVNQNNQKNTRFWRDTHLKIQGLAVYYLQYLFIADWNHCCSERDAIEQSPDYFPRLHKEHKGDHKVQIVFSGPDSDTPSILHTIVKAIYLARDEIQITTPYFVPNQTLMDALCITARSGVKVTLLVPCEGDSVLVDAASEFYYERLLHAGVHIHLYEKGFVHSKTMTVDDDLTIIGTANMDIRSFDLNFEVNAIVYDRKFTQQMKSVFADDIEGTTVIDKERWLNRSLLLQLKQSIARLFSPIL